MSLVPAEPPSPPPSDDDNNGESLQFENEEDNEEYDFDLDPDYNEVTDYQGVAGKERIRGRRNMKEVFNLVSSNLARDIVRKDKYMPGQFEIWNSKKHGGNNKYHGAFGDFDNDGKAEEFIVRRLTKNGQPGPVIAVNGYTTKTSDWPARSKFYTTYPDRKNRKGKNVQSYMRDEYYKPTYADNQIDVTNYEHDPETDPFILKNKDKYNMYVVGKEKSPYRAFGQIIVMPVIKQVLAEIGGNRFKGKFVRKVITSKNKYKAFETYILGGVYANTVKNKIIKKLKENNQYDSFVSTFETLMRDKGNDGYTVDVNDFNSESYKSFDRWLFNKAGIKKMVKSYVSDIISNRAEEFRDKLKQQLKLMIRHEFPNINESANELYHDFVTRETARIEAYSKSDGD